MRRHNSRGAQLSDLAFLLIIFFLVLAGTLSLEQLDLAFPLDGSGDKAEHEPVQVRIEQDGSWSADGRTVGEKELFAEFSRNSIPGPAEKALLILIHRKAPWQSVADLLQSARKRDIASVHMEGMQ